MNGITRKTLTSLLFAGLLGLSSCRMHTRHLMYIENTNCGEVKIEVNRHKYVAYSLCGTFAWDKEFNLISSPYSSKKGKKLLDEIIVQIKKYHKDL